LDLLMNLRTQITEEIDESHWRYLTGWRDPVFPIEGRPFEWSPSRWHVLAFAGGELPVAHIGFGIFEILAGQASVKVIGVGGVVVRPEFQGRHLPELLFAEMHHSELALGLAPTFTLFCPHRLAGYYQRHGYSCFNSKVVFPNRGKLTQSSDFCFMWHGEPLADVPVTLQCPPW